MIKETTGSQQEIAKYIATADIFSNIAESAYAKMAAYAKLYQAADGATIMKEGEVAPMLCLIVSGSVSIIKEMDEPEPRTVATLGGGKILGEMSLMDDLPFSATARAAEDSLLIIFQKDQLNQMALDYPEIHNRILCCLTREISDRLRHTTDVLASHLSQTADLTDALNRALRAAQSRSAFVADMSHQMRTPLNAIIGYSELLEDDIASADIEASRSDIKRIHEACDTMTRLVTDILDLSKIEAGQVKLQLEEIGIDYLLQELATACETLASKRNNKLTIEYAKDIGVIKADEIQLRQILLNLLENASTHTENGNIHISAERIPGDNGEWIIFRVSDTGRGMSPEQIDNIFNRFSQSDSYVRAKYGGTGLGLAISQSLCKMFGGEMDVQSERGKGTTFSVKLPRVPILEQSTVTAESSQIIS